MKILKLLFFILLLLVNPSISFSEHPIDVQKNAHNKEYYKAMISFEKLPKQKANKDVLLSAAQSAWALSLPDTATTLFDKVLNDEKLTKDEKSKIYLYKGIIEFQEEKYSTSKIFAEKSLMLASKDEFKSPAHKLLGDSLFKLKRYSKAKEQYLNALDFSSDEEKSNINYQLGVTCFYLGDFESSKNYFSKVSLDNEDSPFAIRLLIKIALEESNYPALKKWLNVATSEFPDEFLDSYIEYAKIKLAIYEKNKQVANKTLQEAKEKFPQSDPWINLAMASYEAFLWERN